MICKNMPCGKEFVPVNKNQVYCCLRCSKAAWQRKKRNATPETKAAFIARNKAYNESHPEQAKQTEYRNIGKQYVKGKLPAWMYS